MAELLRNDNLHVVVARSGSDAPLHAARSGSRPRLSPMLRKPWLREPLLGGRGVKPKRPRTNLTVCLLGIVVQIRAFGRPLKRTACAGLASYRRSSASAPLFCAIGRSPDAAPLVLRSCTEHTPDLVFAPSGRSSSLGQEWTEGAGVSSRRRGGCPTLTRLASLSPQAHPPRQRTRCWIPASSAA